MSVLVSWVYPPSGFRITSTVLLHGGQNVLAVLNDGIDPLGGVWVMVGVYRLAAFLVVIRTNSRLSIPLAVHPMSQLVRRRPISLPEKEKA